MQFLIDHVASIVISAILILVIATISWRSQSSSIDATQYSAAKTRLIDVANMIERDFSNIGSGVSTAVIVNAIQTFDTLSTIKAFAFFGRIEPADPDSHLIRYEWTQVDSVKLKSSTIVPTYQLTRLVDGVYSGASMSTLTNIRIDLMDADSLAVGGVLASTRLVSISISAVSPLGVGDEIEEPRWQRIFRPVNLTRI